MIRLYSVLTLITAVLVCPLSAQQYAEGCDGNRYVFQVFDNVSKTTVKYARAIPENTDLYIDIYQPENDQVSKRPLILFAHGGAFVGGNKSDMEAFCQYWAQRGFVTASLQYRLLTGLPTQTAFTNAAIKAVSDMKGAYRFFKSDAANANEYGIDTSRIFIGGLSAGAITALHTAYLDAGDNIDPSILTLINANGGFSGNTGDAENLSHNDKDVFGVINLSGAVFVKGLLDEGNAFLMSFHGDKDDVVPIDSNSVFGLIYLYGSRTIHAEADRVGIPNTLTVAAGGLHTDIYTDPKYAGDLAAFLYNSVNLYYPRLCGLNLNTRFSGKPALEVNIYPNPANATTNIEFGSPVDECWIMDIKGAVVKRISPASTTIRLNTSDLHSGTFFLVPIRDNKAYRAVKLQVVH